MESFGEVMSNENLKLRTKKFGLDVISLLEMLPRDRTCDVLGKQLLRSATSVGANYRSACRAKSSADFISKMGNVEEEADESGFWMEMLFDSKKVRADQIKPLLQKANELVAIVVASINTTRKSADHSRPSATPIPNSALRTPHSALRR
jgi:four helix bundle protein